MPNFVVNITVSRMEISQLTFLFFVLSEYFSGVNQVGPDSKGRTQVFPIA